MNIILLAPSGLFLSALEQLGAESSDSVLLVSRERPDAGARAVIVTPALVRATAWAGRVLSGSAIGRNALRLSPLDPGRRFAAATRHSRGLRDEFASADVVVALERDAVLSCWHVGRRHGVSTAVVYGIPAARGCMVAARGRRSR